MPRAKASEVVASLSQGKTPRALAIKWKEEELELITTWFCEKDEEGQPTNHHTWSNCNHPDAAARMLNDTGLITKDLVTKKKASDKMDGMVKEYKKMRQTAEGSGWGIDVETHKVTDLASAQGTTVGRDRSLEANRVTIDRLKARIAKLKSGEELQATKSQLDVCKKQLQECATDMEGLRQRLQDQQHETEDLRNTFQIRDKKICEEAEKTSKEKEDLKKQTKEAARLSDKNLKEATQGVVEQKNELSRKLEIAKIEEQTIRTGVQRLEEQVEQTATENQKALDEKDEKIYHLGQAFRDTKNTLDAMMEQARREASKTPPDHEEEKKKAVEDAPWSSLSMTIAPKIPTAGRRR